MAQQGRDSIAEQLFRAIKENDIETLESTLQRYPELVNRKFHTKWGQTTLLFEACRSDRLGIMRLLLKKGADPVATGNFVQEHNFCHGLPHHCDFSESGIFGALDDNFPLSSATSADAAILQELINANAPINQVNGAGQSALHAATMRPDNTRDSPLVQNIMKLLIENGATVDLQDNNGQTPLHYACKTDKRSYIQILLDNGADITLKDNNGLSPLDIAAHNHYNLTEYIIHYCKLTPQQMIEAYETVALIALHYIGSKGIFEIFSKSTSMRAEHNLPKTILEPVECYGFVREFETLEELETYKDDPAQLRLQARLARERIFADRYVDFTTDSLEDFADSDFYQLNALFMHHLHLFESNNDYLHFRKVFLPQGSIFKWLCNQIILIDYLTHDTLLQFMRAAVKSCQMIHKALQMERRPGAIRQLIRELELTLLSLGTHNHISAQKK